MSEGDPVLAPGDIVSGLETTELVEVRRVAPFGSKTLVEGIGVTSLTRGKRPLSAEELARLQRVRGSDFGYDGDPRAFLLVPKPSVSGSPISLIRSSRSTPAS